MNRSHLVLVVFLVSAQFVGGLARAAQPPLLTLGEPVERRLAIGERHEFRVTLEANQYLLLVVDQRDIDVVVRFYGPDGEHLNRWAENSRTGLESLSLFSNLNDDGKEWNIPGREGHACQGRSLGRDPIGSAARRLPKQHGRSNE